MPAPTTQSPERHMAWGYRATDSGSPTPTTNARFEHTVQCYIAAFESSHWTYAGLPRFVGSMDDDIKLIRQLCTRVGCILEDASVIALIWDDDTSPAVRLQKLRRASANIQALIAAATTMLTDQADL